MSDLARYLTESEDTLHHPVAGDDFGIELEDGTLIDTWIMESDEDSLLLAATPEIMAVMESWMELDLYESDRDEESPTITVVEWPP